MHSLEKSTLGQYICSYVIDSDEILMSLSFSPSSEYLLVGVRSSKIFGCFLKISKNYRPNRIEYSPPQWINTVDDSENGDDSGKTLIQFNQTNESSFFHSFFFGLIV